MGEPLKLPDDVRGRLEEVAEDRGLAVDDMLVVALREWLATRQREELTGPLLAQGGLHRGAPPAGTSLRWRPMDLPGQALSEIVIEDRGPR